MLRGRLLTAGREVWHTVRLALLGCPTVRVVCGFGCIPAETCDVDVAGFPLEPALCGSIKYRLHATGWASAPSREKQLPPPAEAPSWVAQFLQGDLAALDRRLHAPA